MPRAELPTKAHLWNQVHQGASYPLSPPIFYWCSLRTPALQFKRTTPGCVSKLIYSRAPPNPNYVLDPTHPALHFKPVQYAKAFPWRSYPGFSLRAVPKSLLEKPSYPAPNPPFVLAPPRSVYLDKGEAREGKEDARDGAEFEDGRDGVRERPTEGWVEEKDRISMSLVNVASLAVGGRTLRVNVYNKFKNAIALVTTRGADVERGPDGVKRIVFRDDEAGLNWVLRGACFSPRSSPTPLLCVLFPAPVSLPNGYTFPCPLQRSRPNSIPDFTSPHHPLQIGRTSADPIPKSTSCPTPSSSPASDVPSKTSTSPASG